MLFSGGFRAMDTAIDVLVEDARPRPDVVMSVRLLFEQQEQRFSRFRPASLLAQLNAGATVGEPLFVRACHMAVEAHTFTGGRFNPMILPALREAGYGATFASVTGGAPRAQEVPTPGDALVFGAEGVRLANGALDLGGIVKGWTVDLAIEQFGGGAAGLFVNAGGDIRCTGGEGGAAGWDAAVETPGGTIAWTGRLLGALATSTVARRRWNTAAGGVAHHLVDPATGLPAVSPFVQVSAWADETWRAEAWAKAVIIGGEAAAGQAAAAGIRLLAIRDGSEEPVAYG